jgi:hypothetical protein
VLCEVRTSGLKHTGDLLPPHLDRMAAQHELEPVVSERQRVAFLRGDHEVDTTRAEPWPGGRDTRRETFGGDRQRRQRWKPSNHRTHPGLDLEQRQHTGGSLGSPVEVAPGRTILHRPAVEPAEVPHANGSSLGVVDKLVEPAHRDILAASPRSRVDSLPSRGIARQRLTRRAMRSAAARGRDGRCG